jgi:hypothetical protein
MDCKENIKPEVFSGIQNIEIAKKTTGAREMYKHDFHRATFGSDQILAHPFSTSVIENYDPKMITGGSDARRRPAEI